MTPGISELRGFIRDFPDWPEKGIIFRDISPLLADSEAFCRAVEALAGPFEDERIDYVAAIEARGFIFGSAVAERLHAGFVPVRKQGKLPGDTLSATYDLEYGRNTLEIHKDCIKKGSRVLLVDDVLATGGTMAASAYLVESSGGEIAGMSFLIELSALKGREKLKGYNIKSVIIY